MSNQLWPNGPILPTEVPDGILHCEYEGRGDSGIPIWSCTREGAGIVGYGRTDREAMQDFLDKEAELLPDPKDAEIEQQIDDALDQGDGK